MHVANHGRTQKGRGGVSKLTNFLFVFQKYNGQYIYIFYFIIY